MHIQRVQNNNYNTNFGATIKINNEYGKLEKAVVEYLEKQFPKRTKNINADMDIIVSGHKDFANIIGYKSKGFTDYIETLYEDMNQPKETILEGLVNALNGFVIREKGQNKIEALKREIIEEKANDITKERFKES